MSARWRKGLERVGVNKMNNQTLGWSYDPDFLYDIKLGKWPVNRQSWLQSALRERKLREEAEKERDRFQIKRTRNAG